MHHSPSSLYSALIIIALFLGPFLLDYACTRYMRRRAARARIRERLADIRRDSFDVRSKRRIPG